MKLKELFPLLKEGDIILCVHSEDSSEFAEEEVYGNSNRDYYAEYDIEELYPGPNPHELIIEIKKEVELNEN